MKSAFILHIFLSFILVSCGGNTPIGRQQPQVNNNNVGQTIKKVFGSVGIDMEVNGLNKQLSQYQVPRPPVETNINVAPVFLMPSPNASKILNCDGSDVKLKDMTVGSGSTAQRNGAVLVRMIRYEYDSAAPDGKGKFLGIEPMTYDLGELQRYPRLGAYVAGLVRAIVPRDKTAPMKEGGTRTAVMPCIGNVADIELFEVASSKVELKMKPDQLPALSADLATAVTRRKQEIAAIRNHSKLDGEAAREAALVAAQARYLAEHPEAVNKARRAADQAPNLDRLKKSGIPGIPTDQEALKMGWMVWNEQWQKCGDTYLSSRHLIGKDGEDLRGMPAKVITNDYITVELKNLQTNIEKSALTTADEMNGLKWSGVITFTAHVYRSYIPIQEWGRVGWTPWQDGASPLSISLINQNGIWTVQNISIGTEGVPYWGVYNSAYIHAYPPRPLECGTHHQI